jgi:hypothetical protein
MRPCLHLRAGNFPPPEKENPAQSAGCDCQDRGWKAISIPSMDRLRQRRHFSSQKNARAVPLRRISLDPATGLTPVRGSRRNHRIIEMGFAVGSSTQHL